MSGENGYDVNIIGGFGHVGLPLGIVLADVGLKVGLYDIDTNRRAIIRAGRMPFIEHDAEPLLNRVLGKTLFISESLSDVGQAAVVMITIGTPVDEYLNPKLRPMLDLAEQLSAHLRSGHCIILRSTVYPGTSHRLNEFFKSQGLEVHLAYCPERIVQGYAIRELRKLPQIISGFTDEAVRASDRLFRRLGVETVPVAVQEAEFAKLFSNAWRYIQFAITNQLYMMATEHGADFDRIYHAMTHRYERAQDFPRPGFAAGPCLLKDTLQLAAFYGNHFQLGHAAMMVNEGLPSFLVEYLRRDLQVKLANTRVGILGMAFKADIDDIRDSLSYKLAKILRFHGAVVSCSDEFVKDPSFITKEELVATCPVVIVGVPHSAYKELSVPDDSVLVDLWGVLKPRREQTKE
jgi:UDP-N-acetyl-D-mannosaminuronic acid dehydrogenase